MNDYAIETPAREYSQYLEDRKAQKLMERIEEKLMLREKAGRKNSLETSAPKP